jgi:YYY domain-containing protein
MLSMLIWWTILQVIGLLALPLTTRLLRFLPDRGVGFARPVGLALTTYVFWLLVSLGILHNTASNIVLVLILVGIPSLLIARKQGGELLTFLRGERRTLLVTEALFLLSFAAFTLFRAYNPEIAGTEKPMEFAFVNGILNSRSFPPNDPWLSGFSISYYYMGYVMVAMLTRLSGLASDITFNLTVAMLFALTVTGAFSLVSNMVRAYLARQRPDETAPSAHRAAWATGLLGALFVAVMGNLEGVFELVRARGWGSDALWHWLDIKNLQATPPSPSWIPNDPWWWWRASRVIHDRDLAGNSIEVIDEFPFFSFLLGDNHPHVLALPFVLLALVLVLNLLLNTTQRRAERALSPEPSGWLRRLWDSTTSLWPGDPWEMLAYGLLLGSLGFLNTWDFPIYLGILLLAYAMRRWGERPGQVGEWLADTLSMGIALLALGILLYLPFYVGFRSQAGGIGLVGAIKTRLHQYLIMLGISLYGVVGWLVQAFVAHHNQAAAERRLPLLAKGLGLAALLALIVSVLNGWWTAALAFALAGSAAILLVWGSVVVETKRKESELRAHPSVQFALLVTIVGVLLTLAVEFVFLRDTFGNRMNTVFKFYYQAWVLLGIAAAFGAFQVLHRWRESRRAGRAAIALWSAVGALLVVAGLCYTVPAAISKAEGFQRTPTLDGTAYIREYRPHDHEAIQWLRRNATPDAVLLEAPGGSYTEYNWVSAHTGIPTLLGWGGHELQWRGNYQEPGRREPDIATIYQSLDANLTLRLLDQYGIDYVYVGRLERDKYRLSQPMITKFDRIMVRAFENPGVILFARSR